MSMLYMFTRIKFNWNEVDFSVFSTYALITNLLGSTYIMFRPTKSFSPVDRFRINNRYIRFVGRQARCSRWACSVTSWKSTTRWSGWCHVRAKYWPGSYTRSLLPISCFTWVSRLYVLTTPTCPLCSAIIKTTVFVYVGLLHVEKIVVDRTVTLHVRIYNTCLQDHS